MSGLYNAMIGENKNEDVILNAINISKSDFARFRDIDIPPYNRYRQIPLYTDSRFENTDSCKDKDTVVVLTRLGGGNRSSYQDEWNFIKAHPQYVCDYDANFDSTYAFIEFKISKDEMDELQTLGCIHEIDREANLEKVARANMATIKMLSGIFGTPNMDEKELYEKAKGIALKMLEKKGEE